MKAIVGISTRMILILLTLIYIAGCFDESSDSGNSSDGGDIYSDASGYAIVDTGQIVCYDDSDELVTCPDAGEPFYGQDSQHDGHQSSYTDNGDGTVTDNVTGLVWQQSPDTDGDGDIDADDKLSYDEAVARASMLDLGGYNDWRLPTIKELYSLIDFSGSDPSGYEGTDTSGLIPFIDTSYFDFAYGDPDAGERIIDSQYASSNLYVDNSAGSLLFGVNFADGRIKGYGLTMPGSGLEKTFFVIYVRGNTEYGENSFADNGDGTITDNATDLMWSQDDSGSGLDWEDALAWVDQKNAENHLGYSDWRLPNAKELQSIVDYTRSPDTTGSAAIDPLFNETSITNEALEDDYPCYWSSTTHANWTDTPGAYGAYVAFGRAMGYMDGTWVDVHGAGAQRSDPKAGDPADYPTGNGPQGDAIRIYNYVRLVRDTDIEQTNLLDTGQAVCYDNEDEIACPGAGEAFYGQDAQYDGIQFSYTDNGDGTVTDNVTGLMWQQVPSNSKYSWADAAAYVESLSLAGYDDWRVPSLKELFSISDLQTGWPYIDSTYFSLVSAEETKQQQYWSSNFYNVGTTHGGMDSAFGVNHGTGHIKAYPDGSDGATMASKYVRVVRGQGYGTNDFVDNGDGTITDYATELMWMRSDSGSGLNWEDALAWAEQKNAENYLGYSDWRLPNIKELQSIVDYSGVYPAIDQTYFNITDEDAYFWSSTSAYFSPESPGYYYGWYVAFGYAVDENGDDLHGAGAVRFDTKVEGGPAGEDPERIYNYARLVRDAEL